MDVRVLWQLHELHCESSYPMRINLVLTDSSQFDAVAIHWYDVSAEAFIAYIEDFHTTFGYDIIPTEFACQVLSSSLPNTTLYY